MTHVRQDDSVNADSSETSADTLNALNERNWTWGNCARKVEWKQEWENCRSKKICTKLINEIKCYRIREMLKKCSTIRYANHVWLLWSNCLNNFDKKKSQFRFASQKLETHRHEMRREIIKQKKKKIQGEFISVRMTKPFIMTRDIFCHFICNFSFRDISRSISRLFSHTWCVSHIVYYIFWCTHSTSTCYFRVEGVDVNSKQVFSKNLHVKRILSYLIACDYLRS